MKPKNKKRAIEIGELRVKSYQPTLKLNEIRTEIKELCKDIIEETEPKVKTDKETRIAELKMVDYKHTLKQNELQTTIKHLTKELIELETNADLEDFDEDKKQTKKEDPKPEETPSLSKDIQDEAKDHTHALSALHTNQTVCGQPLKDLKIENDNFTCPTCQKIISFKEKKTVKTHLCKKDHPRRGNHICGVCDQKYKDLKEPCPGPKNGKK